MANGFGLTGLVRMMLWPSLKHSLLFALLMRPAQLSGGNGAVASFWLGTSRAKKLFTIWISGKSARLFGVQVAGVT